MRNRPDPDPGESSKRWRNPSSKSWGNLERRDADEERMANWLLAKVPLLKKLGIAFGVLVIVAILWIAFS